MDLGGPTFIAFEGHEVKRISIRAENVEALRSFYGEEKVGVKPVLLKEQKDLDAFYQKAGQRIAKKNPCIGVLIWPIIPKGEEKK